MADPYAEQEKRLKAMYEKKKSEESKPFEVPKQLLDDNHPETEQGSKSPKVGEKMDHKPNRSDYSNRDEDYSLGGLAKKVKARKKYLDDQ